MQTRCGNAVLQLEKLQCLRRIMQMKAAGASPLHRGQMPVLEFIRKNPGCTQVEVAQELLITPSSVAQSTKRMQRDGLLKKETEEDNQRCRRLYLTEKGQSTTAACKKSFCEIDEGIFSGLNDEELKSLEGLLGKLVREASGSVAPEIVGMDFPALMRMRHSMKNHIIGDRE